jgi:homoserine O-acetyltransferase/O-succinyltransferase
MRIRSLILSAALALAFVGGAQAYDGPVEKKTFEMKEPLKTLGGKEIKGVKVGWESYGKLNDAKSNVILITHFFSGNSHAAGKYKPEDAAPGYWNAVIGAGKPIDTDKYFVIASDTLVNLNKGAITTGPSSIDPATGKPYGMSFPVVTIRDFVTVQKALLDSLGVTKLHAVVGASMGALQAFEWATAYPEMVERVVPVIGDAEASGWLIEWLNIWAAPIMLDPNWNGGDYYGKAEPVKGLAEALKVVSLHAQGVEWANKAFGRKWAEEGKNPLDAMGNKFAIEAALEKGATARAAASDANHFLYLVKANQLFLAGHGGSLEEGLKKIKARTLLLPGVGDWVFPPANSQRVRDLMKAEGKDVDYAEIDGPNGHLNGVLYLAKQGDKLKAFLEK